jgi:multiple sugar transport system ATP-binding protein
VKEAGLRFDEHIAGNGEGGLRIDLDASYEAALSGYRDRDITLGIRPEALYIPGVQAPAEAAPPFQVKLEVLEPMGNEIIVYTETAAHRLIARVAPQQLPEPGAMIDIVMDPKRLHFFDRDSGLSLN